MSQMSRDKLSRNIYGARRPIRCTSRRAVGSPGTTPMWRKSMLSGRPTWPICKVSPGRTVEWSTFSPWFMYFPNLPGQSRSIPRTPRQSRRLSSRCSPPRTYAFHGDYKPTKERSSLTLTFRPWWSATVSSTLPVKASKRRPSWSDLTAPSNPGYGHICRTAAPCVGWTSSRTWWTPTTTRTTAPSAWRRPMSRRRTRTDSRCASSGTETATLNLNFRRELSCGPAATRQFLIRATCQTGPRNTLQWVRQSHLEEGLNGAYISW